MSKSDPTAGRMTGVATIRLSAHATIHAYAPLPDAHPFYAIVGRVASEWARLEHILDMIIWELADLDPKRGACITAQFMGPAPRYNTIATLARYKGLNPALAKRIARLKQKTFDVSEQRNRYIHDPWLIELDSGGVAQFRAMPAKNPRYGFEPIAPEETEKTISRIKDRLRDALELREDILIELETSHGRLPRPRPPVPPQSAP